MHMLAQQNFLNDQIFFRPFDITSNPTCRKTIAHDFEQLDDNDYRVTLAVPGFRLEELKITLLQQTLSIEAQAKDDDKTDDDKIKLLHHGICSESFKKDFHLDEHIKVEKAKLENGLLRIYLKREIPESSKPQTIKIEKASAKQTRLESISTESKS